MRRRLTLLDRERRPQPRVPTADDADVRRDIAVQRGRGAIRPGFVPPPGHCLQRRFDGHDVAAERSRRIWKRTFPTIPTTAIRKIALPITFTCGGIPRCTAPQTKSGNVIFGPLLK